MRKTLRVGLALAALAVVACGAGAPQVFAGGRIATVSGSVLDGKGNPIAGAVVSVIKDGADEVIKQVKSAADGSFITKIAPGRYSLRAVAAGFNAVLFYAVQVRPADEVVYRFNLEPVGSGRTAPERRKDRDDRKDHFHQMLEAAPTLKKLLYNVRITKPGNHEKGDEQSYKRQTGFRPFR